MSIEKIVSEIMELNIKESVNVSEPLRTEILNLIRGCCYKTAEEMMKEIDEVLTVAYDSGEINGYSHSIIVGMFDEKFADKWLELDEFQEMVKANNTIDNLVKEIGEKNEIRI